MVSSSSRRSLPAASKIATFGWLFLVRYNTRMTYETTPHNVLPNGLTLLQVNPDCAAQLNPSARDYGWLYVKGANDQWVTLRKMTDFETDIANDQAADMAVLQGSLVRGIK